MLNEIHHEALGESPYAQSVGREAWLMMVPGQPHNLHMGGDGEAVLDDVETWIQAQFIAGDDLPLPMTRN